MAAEVRRVLRRQAPREVRGGEPLRVCVRCETKGQEVTEETDPRAVLALLELLLEPEGVRRGYALPEVRDAARALRVTLDRIDILEAALAQMAVTQAGLRIEDGELMLLVAGTERPDADRARTLALILDLVAEIIERLGARAVAQDRMRE